MGNYLKEARELLGWSPDYACQEAGVSLKTLNLYEGYNGLGWSFVPPASDLINAYGKSGIDFVFGKDGNEMPRAVKRKPKPINHLWQARELAGWTLEAAATASELSPETIENYERLEGGWAHDDPNMAKMYRAYHERGITFQRDAQGVLRAWWLSSRRPLEPSYPVDGDSLFVRQSFRVGALELRADGEEYGDVLMIAHPRDDTRNDTAIVTLREGEISDLRRLCELWALTKAQ